LLLHDDDLIDNDFIETCIEVARHDRNTGIVRTGTRVIGPEGEILHEWENRVEGTSTEIFFLGWFKGKTTMFLCSTLFHTERLRSIGGFNSKYNLLQDVKAVVQLAAMYKRIEIKDVKASFRRHELEMTLKTRVIDWCNESLELLELMCNLILEKKALVYREGMRFFANLNYRRAKSVKSFLKRIVCYAIIFQKFRFRYPPPPVYRLLRFPHRLYRFLGKHLYSSAFGT
jgi:hypothetical protein